MGPVVPTTIFSNLISMIGADRLMPGVQYSTMNSLAQILSSVPEGGEAAGLIRMELEQAVSRGREDARIAKERMRSLLSETDADQAPPSSVAASSIEKIDYVSPALVKALSAALPVLEKAMDSPSEEVLQAFEKLKRIAVLTSMSRTMNAVLDASTVDRARDLGRPRVESPAVRYLEKMIFPSDPVPSGRYAPVFFRDGKVVHFNQWSELLEMLGAHFGSEVTRESLDELFTLPYKDYRIAAVDMRKDGNGNLRFAGEIRQDHDRVGYFTTLLPAVPPRGTPWAVKVEAISIIHKRVGIGGQLLARLALFLHQRGVHTMKADAMEEAGLFCVFNGFRLDKSLYEEIVDDFLEEAARRGFEIPREQVRRLLDRDSNLAELAAFEWNGRRVGRDFLQSLFTQKYLPVRFELSADKQSWLRLLSNLHRNEPETKLGPLEWARLDPATRGLLYSGVFFVGGNVPNFMSSDRDHAIHLVERLNNWATFISMCLDFPARMWERMPEERKSEFQEKRVAIAAVLEMIAADPSSSLFSHFHDLMSPGTDGATGDQSTNRAFLIARTLLGAESKKWIQIPDALRGMLEELVSRSY